MEREKNNCNIVNIHFILTIPIRNSKVKKNRETIVLWGGGVIGLKILYTLVLGVVVGRAAHDLHDLHLHLLSGSSQIRYLMQGWSFLIGLFQ